MRKINFALLAVLIGLLAVSCEKEKESATAYTLDANGKLEKAGTYFLGTDKSKPAGDYYFAQDIEISQFVVSHSFGDWGFGEGFTYSNCFDATTPGYTNMSAIAAKGVKGDTYFIANAGGWDTPAQITFKDGKEYKAVECYVTNSTYAYLAVKDGNDGFGGVKKDWGQADEFILTITGYNGDKETGKVDFYLAKGTDIVSTWQQVDLKKLGTVTKIKFTLSSTDMGDWGMNTPAYFCLDQLKVSE